MSYPRFRFSWRTGLLSAAFIAAAVVIAMAAFYLAKKNQLASRRTVEAVQTLAKETGSSKVWEVYAAQSRHGLTDEGAEKVREAAKAASPPYGLIHGEEDDVR